MNEREDFLVSFGGGYTEGLVGIAYSRGGVFVLIQMDDETLIGGKMHYPGYIDALLVKLEADGSVEWSLMVGQMPDTALGIELPKGARRCVNQQRWVAGCGVRTNATIPTSDSG